MVSSRKVKILKRVCVGMLVVISFFALVMLLNVTSYLFLLFQKPNINSYVVGDKEVKVHTINLLVTNSYVLVNEGAAVVIDTGMPLMGPIINNYIKRNLPNTNVNLIVITHAHLDHYGSANQVSAFNKAPVAIGFGDSQQAERGSTDLGLVKNWLWLSTFMVPYFEPLLQVEPVKAGVVFSGGESLEPYGMPATILHTPGHTKGSISVLLGNKVAFVGDLITTRGDGSIQKTYFNDKEDLQNSLILLKVTGVDYYYSGHGNKPLSREEFNELFQ